MSMNTNGHEWGNEMDRPEHEKTYEAFLSYLKGGTIAIIGVLVFLLLFVYG